MSRLRGRSAPVVRTAELCAATSLFTDLGTGEAAEHAMRTCLVAMQLGDVLSLSEEERSELYYVSLLRFLGCSADASTTAAAVGSGEAAFYGAMAAVNMVRRNNSSDSSSVSLHLTAGSSGEHGTWRRS